MVIEASLGVIIGLVSVVAGAGASHAVTKNKVNDVVRRFEKHEEEDDKIHMKVLESLGRIEGTLDEMKRTSR